MGMEIIPWGVAIYAIMSAINIAVASLSGSDGRGETAIAEEVLAADITAKRTELHIMISVAVFMFNMLIGVTLLTGLILKGNQFSYTKILSWAYFIWIAILFIALYVYDMQVWILRTLEKNKIKVSVGEFNFSLKKYSASPLWILILIFGLIIFAGFQILILKYLSSPTLVLINQLIIIILTFHLIIKKPDAWIVLLIGCWISVVFDLICRGEGFGLITISKELKFLSIGFLNFASVIFLYRKDMNLSLHLRERFIEFKTFEIESARQLQELEDARKLQLSMLPQDRPPIPQINIAWYMETATEVGGDYYDYMLDSEGNLTIVLGDATGHGMQAGTVVTASKSLFQSMGNQPQIIETFKTMSKSLKNMNLPRLGMAMTMLKLNDNKLRLSSAGMPPMLLYRASTGKAEEVLLEGMPLGYSENAEYEELEIEMSEGDTVLLMSDGLPERMNTEDEWLDYPKILEEFETVGRNSPDEIIEHLVGVGEAWANGLENDDDESFIVLKFKGN